jgi:hypothetical protein
MAKVLFLNPRIPCDRHRNNDKCIVSNVTIVGSRRAEYGTGTIGWVCADPRAGTGIVNPI